MKQNFRCSWLVRALLLLCLTFQIPWGGVFTHAAQTAQQNTIRIGNVTNLKELIQQIESQTSYRISYQGNLADNIAVKVDRSKHNVEELLADALRGTGISYVIRYNTIILKQEQPRAEAAQQESQTRHIVGRVIDAATKEPIIGATVWVKDSALGTSTNVDGAFDYTFTGHYGYIAVSYIGYQTQEFPVTDIPKVIELSAGNELDEVVVVGYGTQKKASVVGTIATGSVNDIRMPTANISNNLAGQLAGVISVQRSGEPGASSTFWIRGISTFGAGSSALILVDGFERSMNELNIEDIESFTVLKDASATAIYGSRGANGVVLITTKRGKGGKVQIDAKVETTYNTRTITPDLIDGYTYASMMNEARTTRNQEPFFPEDKLYILRNGLDQDLYPNVDWMDVLLKKGAPTYRATINMNGGGSLARYYVSASYVDEGGMYKVDKGLKDYNTNANYRRWNYRLNVDMDITKTTLLKVGVSGSLDKKNEPGMSSNIWASAMNYNPVSVPIMYSNGYTPAFGSDDEQINPWTIATQTGYQETWNNKLQTNITLEQDFSFITKGLKFIGRYGFDTNNYQWINRKKIPELWRAEQNRASDGSLVMRKVRDEQLMSQEANSTGERKEYLEAELHYDRTFGNHMVGAVMKYTQDKTINASVKKEDDIMQGIDRRHQGLSGRFTYGWKYRYFVDFNFGYNGSENFATGHQFGFFPAYSVAWNMAEESFIKKKSPWINMFKVRYSYGKVGNDNMDRRFPYLSTFGASNNYNYADLGQSYQFDGLTYTYYATNAVTWEIATKHDIGIDFALFNDKLTGTIDYFHEQRDGIYQERNYIPLSVGMYGTGTGMKLSTNIGSVVSKGFDGNVGYKQRIGDVNLTLRGNFTYSKSEILKYDEEFSNYPYKSQQGFRVNQTRGLISLGLFKDYDDIRDSPKQSWGDVMPGDIKYADVNGDGKIDENDEVPIGATNRPNLIYGFGLSAGWKGFDINILFQGAGKSTFCIEGPTVYPFKNGDWGNILTDMANSNRWILGENENPNAEYPRLSYGGNSNNYRPSTYWLRNGSYLRLKNLEIGYNIPKSLINKIHLNNVRLYFMGTNLITFSNFKLWDPELGSTNGQAYPLSRSYTLGLTINI